MLKHNNEDNPTLRKATKKYGYENFKIEVIKYCDEEKLDFYEQYYIQLYNSHIRENGYNIELGGSTHKHLSKDQIERMKNTKTGKLTGKDNPFYGKKHTLETKKIISEKNKNNKYCVGRYMSKETRKKIGEANRWHKTKAIECYDLNNNFIRKYESVAEAKRQLKVKSSSFIANCARGNRMSAYGYKWKYADDNLQKAN